MLRDNDPIPSHSRAAHFGLKRRTATTDVDRGRKIQPRSGGGTAWPAIAIRERRRGHLIPEVVAPQRNRLQHRKRNVGICRYFLWAYWARTSDPQLVELALCSTRVCDSWRISTICRRFR